MDINNQEIIHHRSYDALRAAVCLTTGVAIFARNTIRNHRNNHTSPYFLDTIVAPMGLLAAADYFYERHQEKKLAETPQLAQHSSSV